MVNVFNFPSKQRLWAVYDDAKGKPRWAICSDQARVKYYLYNLESGKPVKVKTGASPTEFEGEVGKI